jgi:hypothetical protein
VIAYKIRGVSILYIRKIIGCKRDQASVQADLMAFQVFFERELTRIIHKRNNKVMTVPKVLIIKNPFEFEAIVHVHIVCAIQDKTSRCIASVCNFDRWKRNLRITNKNFKNLPGYKI